MIILFLCFGVWNYSVKPNEHGQVYLDKAMARNSLILVIL